MELSLEKVKASITNKKIIVHGEARHTKASELYLDVEFQYDAGRSWRGLVPYWYRRTGVLIESEEELGKYLDAIYPHFSEQSIRKFREDYTTYSETELSSKAVTKPFFDLLLSMEWLSVQHDFPRNPNWARRIQDIKELGFTLSTDTNRKVKGKEENDTHLRLLPIPRGAQTGYESFTPAFRKKVLKLLGNVNAYDLSSGNKSGLLPDHKFPEIRWDDSTREENDEEMTDAEIRSKFQLLDNQRNQQKREMCRNCFQTGQRGVLHGIRYFYSGGEQWPINIPRTGAEAKQGCVGCGWYDMDAWRTALNQKLTE